jgi:hypothetical protein
MSTNQITKNNCLEVEEEDITTRDNEPVTIHRNNTNSHDTKSNTIAIDYGNVVDDDNNNKDDDDDVKKSSISTSIKDNTNHEIVDEMMIQQNDKEQIEQRDEGGIVFTSDQQVALYNTTQNALNETMNIDFLNVPIPSIVSLERIQLPQHQQQQSVHVNLGSLSNHNNQNILATTTTGSSLATIGNTTTNTTIPTTTRITDPMSIESILSAHITSRYHHPQPNNNSHHHPHHHHDILRAIEELDGLEKEEQTLIYQSQLIQYFIELFTGETYTSITAAIQSFDIFELTVPRRVCQHPFRKNDIVWVCRTCQADETCVLCHNCFSQSNHIGHDVAFYHAQAGGCCDCGDPDGTFFILFSIFVRLLILLRFV